MAGLINQLLVLLGEQSERYEELLGLSQEKRDVIIANDVESLQKITHLENLLVSQNQKLEKKRIAVIKDMSLVLNKKENELTLSALIEMMEGQEEQAALIEVRERIQKTLKALSEANTINGSLINNALDYIEYSLNVMRTSINQNPSFYTVRGEQMMEETSKFDAKH